MKPNLDISRINLEEFFGCVYATNTTQMKSNAFKTIRTWLQEKSFAKWSDGLLQYVGDYKDGVDFISENNVKFEMKGKLKMFNKNGSTSSIVLKNFQSDNKVIEKTFDYMLLVDTGSMALGITDWETVEKRIYYTPKSPTAKVKFLPGDFTMLAKDIKPAEKKITSAEILDNLQEIL
jgi:hypothetical protein|tara:strand:- start:957 stop:1487 length:531 start_codon:yes stop_codon:yes gene_type:complete